MRQLARRGIADERVLAAFRRVPREAFVPADLAESAYDDNPLPIAEGQTISQPYIVALMAEAARIGPDARVLEVGAGSGYAAAILAELADGGRHRRAPRRARRGARAVLQRLGYSNVAVIHGDGSRGLPERAPYDAILVAAGAPAPPDFAETPARRGRPPRHSGQRQLSPGAAGHHAARRRLRRERSRAVRFVPLIEE